MASLTPKQRRWVLAMLSDPLGNPTEWAKAAGYSDTGGGAKVAAFHNAHNERLKEAAREEARRHLDTIGPVLGIGVMFQIARDPRHKRQLDAAIALANRAGFHEKTEHTMKVEHRVDTQELEALARRLAAELGLTPAQLLGGSPGVKQIEGEAAEEISP
jgi:phage terminase small subunit